MGNSVPSPWGFFLLKLMQSVGDAYRAARLRLTGPSEAEREIRIHLAYDHIRDGPTIFAQHAQRVQPHDLPELLRLIQTNIRHFGDVFGPQSEVALARLRAAEGIVLMLMMGQRR